MNCFVLIDTSYNNELCKVRFVVASSILAPLLSLASLATCQFSSIPPLAERHYAANTRGIKKIQERRVSRARSTSFNANKKRNLQGWKEGEGGEKVRSPRAH